MSVLIGASLGSFSIVHNNDDRLQPVWYSIPDWKAREDTRWPESQLRNGSSMGGACLDTAPLIWDWLAFTYAGGGEGQRRNIVTGITLDATGAPLGSCTVKLYETASDAVMDTGVVSDPVTGVYVATSPNNTACYAVAYKTGAPDREGTTVNTLTPV